MGRTFGGRVKNTCRVGVDIGGTKLLTVLLQADRCDVQRDLTGPDTTPTDIERHIIRAIGDFGRRPAALGIAVPGLVDADGRVESCDVLPRLAGWRPADTFAALGCPVAVLNDAEAALIEETRDLAADATAGIVMAGTAIGAAFIAQGVPLRGARGWAGELGYLPVRTPRGVLRLDEVAAGMAITARLGIAGPEVKARAEKGDRKTRSEIRRAGAALGLGLATVVNLLNPELLVLEGGLFDLPGYRESALRSAARYSLPELWRACTLRPARAGHAVVALGAARSAGGD